MAAPFKYRDLSELMGSWPMSVLKDPAPAQQLQPNSLQTKATFICTRRGTSVGYNIGGLSLYCFVDVAGVPTSHTVTFPGGTGGGTGGPNYFTIAQVITRFQASTPPLPANTAQNSDGFLLLQSQTSGETSYLRLESIPGAEGVFDELGLQPGVIARGGDIKVAQHIDPTRQVAGLTQVALQHGENFSADTMNRLLMQLGINAGASYGETNLRRVAVKVKESFVGSGAAGVQLNSSNPDQGVFTGLISTPTYDQLLDLITVLDEDGNEFTREVVSVLTGPTADYNFSVEANTGKQLCSSVSAAFTSGDVAANRYVRVTDFGAAAVLNSVPLKIIEYKSSTLVVVLPINPTTGVPIAIAESNRSGSRIELFHVRAEIEGFYSDSGFTTRVEQQQVSVTGGSGAVTRVETANRIFVSSATFLTATKVGDLVTWTGASISTPYSNNGVYRVSKVLDNKRIELVNEDYTPCFLNPSIGGGQGTISLTTDGEFFRTPYVKFAPATGPNFTAGRGAVPQSGDNFQLVYLVESSLRSALDADPSILSGSTRYEAGVAAGVQQALMRIAGPSVTSFDDILHGNFDLSLEKLDYRVDKEHYEQNGRHSTIRPDVIDMFPDVVGVGVTFRGNDSEATTVSKVRFVQETSPSTYVERLAFRNNGDLAFTTTGGTATPHTPGQGIAVRFGDDTLAHKMSMEWAASNAAGPALLRFNVLNDGSGGTKYNSIALAGNGFVGVGMGTAAADTGAAGEPQAPLHVRATSVSGELIRLEGVDGDYNTVAISFKPKKTDPYYGFIEMDSAGPYDDWFINFVTTPEAEADSFLEGAGFRWIQSISGVPTEVFTVRGTAGGGYGGFIGPVAGLTGAAIGNAPINISWSGNGSASDQRVKLSARKYGTGIDDWLMRIHVGQGASTGLEIANKTGFPAVAISWPVHFPVPGAGGLTSFDFPLTVAQRPSGGAPAIILVDQTSNAPTLAFAVTGGSAPDDVAIRATSTRRLQVRVEAIIAVEFGAKGIATAGGNAPRAQLDVRGDLFAYDEAILLAQTDSSPSTSNGTRKTIRWNLVQFAPSTAAQLRFQPVWETGTATAGAADPGLAMTRNAHIGLSNIWDSDDTAKTSSGFFMESAQGNGVEDRFTWRFAAATVGVPSWTTRAIVRNTSPEFEVDGTILGTFSVETNGSMVAAAEYTYPTVRTFYRDVNLGGAMVDTLNCTNAVEYGGHSADPEDGAGNNYWMVTSGGDDGSVRWPIDLPAGAELVAVHFVFNQLSGVGSPGSPPTNHCRATVVNYSSTPTNGVSMIAGSPNYANISNGAGIKTVTFTESQPNRIISNNDKTWVVWLGYGSSVAWALRQIYIEYKLDIIKM